MVIKNRKKSNARTKEKRKQRRVSFHRALTRKVGKLILELRGFSRPGIDDPITESRRCHVAALTRLGTFFNDVGDGDLAVQFGDLASALFGLEDGTAHPLLTPKRKGGRHRDRSDIWRLRMRAVHGVECLMLGGLSPKDATQQAAKEFKSLEKLLRPVSEGPENVNKKISLSSSLLSWRTAAVNNKLTDPLAIGSEREFRDIIKNLGPLSSEDAITLGKAYLKSASDEAINLHFAASPASISDCGAR